MINPNRNYKGTSLATVIKVDSPDAYIPYVTIQTDDGRVLEGSLERAYFKPELIKVGQRVGYEVQWSIMADKPLIARLIRKREVV